MSTRTSQAHHQPRGGAARRERAESALQRARRRAGDRTTNLTLGVLLTSAVLSGAVANAFGTAATRWVLIAHGIAGIALLVLSPRKTRIAHTSLTRPRRRPGTTTSLALATTVITAVATGLAHATGAVELPAPLSLMQVHIGAAVLAVPLAWSHYRHRTTRASTPAPVRVSALRPAGGPAGDPASEADPRPSTSGAAGPGDPAGAAGSAGAADLQRRALLRVAATTATAGLGWWGWEQGLRATRAPGGARRFTGSLPVGDGDPEAMPVTSWLDDRIPSLQAATWTLRAGRRHLDLAALQDLAGSHSEPVTAVLDCTSAWCSTQRWSGIRLDRLLPPAELRGARSVLVRSATGYARRLPVTDLHSLWLATHVGDQPLSPGHGYPARLVAPGRRGFWWVKWVTEISASPTPWWIQEPYPLT